MIDFVTTEEIHTLLQDLRKAESLAPEWTLRCGKATRKLLQRTISKLVSLSRAKVVEIEIFEGANFKFKTLPDGATLVVRKFNVQGTAFSTKTYKG